MKEKREKPFGHSLSSIQVYVSFSENDYGITGCDEKNGPLFLGLVTSFIL